jgi:outer membrane protein assembly factor BamB
MPKFLHALWSAAAGRVLTFLVLGALAAGAGEAAVTAKKLPIAIVVMDPLAAELSCACVRGYGQRDYHKLAAYLARELGRQTTVSFSEDLADALARLTPGLPVIVIGQESLIAHDAPAAGFQGRALARLTDQEGAATITGLFVVKAGDPAATLQDLARRRIFFGPANAAERRAAALAALNTAGVTPPERLETRETSSDAALEIVDSALEPPPAAVISSYALPLLEGCGSLKPGDLKIVGRTEPVPFMAVFASDSLPAEQRRKLTDALLALRKPSRLLRAMESRNGFVPVPDRPPVAGVRGAVEDWPDWRGPRRDGHVAWLPARLPASPRLLWKQPALNGGLAGLAVAQGCLLVADRDPADERDVFRCLDADTGELRWLVDYPAPGRLDYGQFPRATPVLRAGRAWLLGAFGDLRCVNLADGKVLWKRHYLHDLGGRLPKWGACATPLLVDDLLIVNPGGPQASLVALDARTGRHRWKSPGSPAAYASFIAATLGGRRQIVGYDEFSLGGWDPKTGERLWKLVPPVAGDFNVPTPLVVEENLFVATENNGARLYGFDAGGRILPNPIGTYADLAPDTATPVCARGRVFGAYLGLHCLDARHRLQCLWRAEDKAGDEHASLFASDDRVLLVALNGELLLLAADAGRFEVLSRLRLFADDADIYSHPALVGAKLYVRGADSVCCFDLSGE